MSFCPVCNKSVNRTGQEKIACLDCKNYCHLVCVNVKKQDLEFFAENPWRCEKCVKARRQSRGDGDSVSVSGCMGVSESLDLVSVEKLLRDFRTDIINGQRRLEDELVKSINLCHDKIEQLTKSLQEQTELIKDQRKTIEVLSAENSEFRASLAVLEKRCDDLEQYGRRNIVEIQGVPDISGENVVHTVQSVAKALDVTVTEQDIDACHRLKSRSPGKSAIVVRFVRRGMADGLMEARRKKRDLCARHIGLSADTRIYVNLSLTRARKNLLSMARKAFREGILADVWVDRCGRIKVRKTKGCAQRVVSCDDELSRVVDSERSRLLVNFYSLIVLI